MFDIGWSELLFLAVLGLVVIGPRDLPKFIQIVGGGIARLRRAYREGIATLHQLEREIDVASRPVAETPGVPEYYALLPEHVRARLLEGDAEPLRDAAAHAQRQAELDAALAEAKQRHALLRADTASGTS